MDLQYAIGWLAIGLLICLALLSRPSVWNFLGPPLIRLVGWTLAQIRPAREPSEEDDDLWNVLRREQLSAHVRRLQRILATDDYMSATRQIANRLAYRQLLHELKEIPDVWAPMPATATASRWNSPPVYPMRSEAAATVEVLEIGWRPRRGDPPHPAGHFRQV